MPWHVPTSSNHLARTIKKSAGCKGFRLIGGFSDNAKPRVIWGRKANGFYVGAKRARHRLAPTKMAGLPKEPVRAIHESPLRSAARPFFLIIDYTEF